MPTLLPTPSREPTNKLSAQCDYRPTDPPAARLGALVGCLEDGSFAYKSLANRLNLIRNLQGPTMRKYREMYTRDLKRLKQHVTTVRATLARARHAPGVRYSASPAPRRLATALVPPAP